MIALAVAKRASFHLYGRVSTQKFLDLYVETLGIFIHAENRLLRGEHLWFGLRQNTIYPPCDMIILGVIAQCRQGISVGVTVPACVQWRDHVV